MGICFSQVHPDKKSPPIQKDYKYYYNTLSNGCGNNLIHVPIEFIDVEMCVYAIMNKLCLDTHFNCIPEKLYGDDLFVCMIRENFSSMEKIPKDHRTLAVITEYVNHDIFVNHMRKYSSQPSDEYIIKCDEYIKSVDFSMSGVVDLFFNKYVSILELTYLLNIIPLQYHTHQMFEWMVTNYVSVYERLKVTPEYLSKFYLFLRSSIFKENKTINSQTEAELFYKSCLNLTTYSKYLEVCLKMIPVSLITPDIYELCVYKIKIDVGFILKVPKEYNGKLNINFTDISDIFYKLKEMKYSMWSSISGNINTLLNRFYEIIPSNHSEIDKIDVMFVIELPNIFKMIPKERQTLYFFSNIVEKYDDLCYEISVILKGIPSQFYFQDKNLCFRVAWIIYISKNKYNLDFNLIPAELLTTSFYQKLLNQNLFNWYNIPINDTTKPIFTSQLYEKIINLLIESDFTTLKTITKLPSHLITNDIFLQILKQEVYHDYDDYNHYERQPAKIPAYWALILIFPNIKFPKEVYSVMLSQIITNNDINLFNEILPTLKELFYNDGLILQNIAIFQQLQCK
jgi:hypothetical protein